VGGIIAKDISDVILHFDGSLIFTDNTDTWPTTADGKVLECLYFENISNVTFTSSHIGLIDGSGPAWWGLLGYVEYLENRPRLLSIGASRSLLLENLYFKNSPYWTVWIHEVDGLEIRNCEISNRRNDYDGHDWYNLCAFNTDGFDVAGKNVWIHDCKIWNQDDCIAVKDGSENMLFERIHASGLGLVIGSIGGSTVRNITFRDSYMHKTYKGIYTKFRGSGLIQDVLYENIVMFEPEQWPIWIGPAQQADSIDICKADPCSLCWPDIPFAECNMPADAQYINLTLRNITVINPASSGVILGSTKNPIQNLTFDGVVIKNAPADYFVCSNVVNGIATGGTFPVPSCFNKK
jgi:polygalacturonase